MHHTFIIFKSEDKLKERWIFLAKRAFISDNSMFRKNALVIGSALLVYVLLLLFTANNRYVTLKAVSSVLMLLAVLFLFIFSLITLYNNLRYKKFVERDLDVIISSPLNYQVDLNEDTVKIITGIVLNEYSWSDFSAYGINNNTIYIFNTSEPLMSLFWSQDEIGEEIFQFIVETLKKKEIGQRF